MLFEPQTPAAIDIIRQGRGATNAAQWEAIKASAQAWRPEGYDDAQKHLRQQYEGDILADLQEAINKRYPLTGHKMPAVPLNWAKLFADNAASVYDWPAHSYLERDDGTTKTELSADEPGPDQERARAFADMVLEAELQPLLAEMERRVKVFRTMFGMVYSDSVEARASGKPPRTRVGLWGPTDVAVIPHSSAPTSLTAAVGLIVRVASPDGVSARSKAYNFWSRTYEDDAAGLPVSFSPWRVQRVIERVNDKGEQSVTIEPVLWPTSSGGISEEYPLPTLPWVVWHDGVPDGCPYLDGNRNLVDLFRAANQGLMAEQFASDMSSATPLIRKTNRQQPNAIALGPGVMPAIPIEDEIIPIPLSADFEGMRSVNKALLGAMALTSRQRIEGYDVEASSVPVSGVALKIKGEPQAKARLESIARATVMHESLLALMIEVHDYFRATGIAEEGIRARVRFAQPPEYEDAEVTARRLIGLRDAGVLSDVELRTMTGLSRTKEDAEAAVAAIRQERQARAPARMAEIVGDMETDQPDPEDDPEDEDQPPEVQ